MLGWKVSIMIPDYPKCIVCVAPHTSNWDFHFGRTCLYLDWAQSRFSDEGYLVFLALWDAFFRAIGGIAVPRRHKGKRPLTEVVAEMFNESDRLTIAITPKEPAAALPTGTQASCA